MKTEIVAARTAEAARVDIYALIHKAVRAFMCETLTMLGSLDGSDERTLADGLAQVRSLAAFCASHLRHENAFVHTAMEARQPGSAQALQAEHVQHEEELAHLLALVQAVEDSKGQPRDITLMQLYRRLALFVGENLKHMHVEETEHNAVLWSAYTDEELIDIEQAIVASIPPEESAVGMGWMIPAMNPSERAEKLAGIRAHAPAPVFDALLGIAEARLSQCDWIKLQQALALPERLAA